MRIVCPVCDATYDVPDAMLGGGIRKVRCAKCDNEWVPTPASVAPLPLPDLELEPPPPPEPFVSPPVPETDPLGRHEPRLKPLRPRPESAVVAPPEEAPAPAPAPVRGGAGAVVAWVLTLVVLIGAAGAAVTWRGKVMTAWPPSERVFLALGLR